jgi:hypothetical protein
MVQVSSKLDALTSLFAPLLLEGPLLPSCLEQLVLAALRQPRLVGSPPLTT